MKEYLDNHKFIKELIPYVVIVLVVVFIRSFIMTPIIVDGASMEPTLVDGEMMILYKLGKIEREDIVVINNNEGYIIKRVIGLPGETVLIEDNILYIDGMKYDEDNFINENDFYEIELNSDEYFVLGDNREVSKDSRSFGAVVKDEILGETNIVFFPFNKIGFVE